MAITMQGNWTVQVSSRNAAYAQRFIVEGADTGNGAHDGIEGKRIHVTGAHWTLQVQHRPTRQPWRDSRQRLGLPNVEAGLLRVSLCTNDGGLDEDYDDLVLDCSFPVSRSEHVVYGEVASHQGGTPFNPKRDDYLVLDAPVDVQAVCEGHPALAPVLEKLYPQRLSAASNDDLSPLVLPNGLPGAAVGLRFESAEEHADGCGPDQVAAVERLQAQVSRVPFQSFAMEAGAALLTQAEQSAIASLRDELIRRACDARPAAGVTLRFQSYHRSESEAVGGAYRGSGLREELGSATADELGRYLFRFRRRGAAVLPDLVVQVAAAGVSPCFETAPYARVAHLRRIDLCVPHAVCAAPRRVDRQQAPDAGERHTVNHHEKRAAEAALSRRRCS
jgi:hypothetical protein